MSSSPTIPQLTRFKADAISLRETLVGVNAADFTTVTEFAEWVKTQLALNIVPLFEALVDAVNDDIVAEVADLGQQVDQLLEETGDMLSEEAAAVILSALEGTRQLANLLEKQVKHADALTRKRAGDAIRDARAKELAAREMVESITMPDDEEADDEPAAPDVEVAPDGADALEAECADDETASAQEG